MGAGGPVQILRLAAPADNCCKSELILLGIKSLESCLHAVGACDGSGIDAGFLKNGSVVSKADRFCCVREADDLAVCILVACICISCPRLIAQVSQLAGPVAEVCIGTANEDVGHVVSLEIALKGILDVDAAAHGLDRYRNACLSLVSLSCCLQSCINFDLAVDKTDVAVAGSCGSCCFLSLRRITGCCIAAAG